MGEIPREESMDDGDYLMRRSEMFLMFCTLSLLVWSQLFLVVKPASGLQGRTQVVMLGTGNPNPRRQLPQANQSGICPDCG